MTETQLQEFRVQRLKDLSNRYGGNTELGRRLGYSSGAHIGNMISGFRPITEKFIIKAESTLRLNGWFSDQYEPIENTGVKTNPLIHQLSKIPVVGTAKLGDQEAYFVELEYPVGSGDGFIEWPSRDPNAYALRCVGDSMMPRIRHGEYVIIEPNHEIVNGDDVVVKDKSGRVMVKILSNTRDDRNYFESINNAYAPFPIDKNEIDIMHYVAGIAKSSMHRAE